MGKTDVSDSVLFVAAEILNIATLQRSYNRNPDGTWNWETGAFGCSRVVRGKSLRDVLKTAFSTGTTRDFFEKPKLLCLLQERTSVMDKLNEHTYAVQHNPNCHSPFLVRLVRWGAGCLDYKPEGETSDILGYGRTLEEAASVALDAKRGQRVR